MKIKTLHYGIGLASLLMLSGCNSKERATAQTTMASQPITESTNAALHSVNSAQPFLGLVPAPAHLEIGSGSFTFNTDTTISINTPELFTVADYWVNFFTVATGFNLPVVHSTSSNQNHDKNSVILELVKKEAFTGSNTEAYVLSVTSEQINIQASTPRGIFYGLMSLRQLLPAQVESPSPINNISWAVPAVTIEDEPLYSYRGMHLDVSRHFFPVEFIKRYIDILAFHKMNYFHWHLTDDQGWRIHIDAYPLLTEKSARREKTVIGHTYDRDVAYRNEPVEGFYTKAQIKDIVEYAAQRHVTIIPEIDIPGHASTILYAYPEFGCDADAKPKSESQNALQQAQVQPHFGIFPQVLCPTEPTFEFLRVMFGEVAEMFPGEYLHIGGDEVKKTQWKQSKFVSELMQRENLADYHEVQSYFIRRVSEIVTDLDKKMIGWNEILDGGIAPNATIMSWQGTEGGIAAAEMGHDAIMSPGNYVYFDHFQSRSIDEPLAIHGITPLSETYSYNPMPEAFAGTEKAKHILGAQGQLWTEYVPTPEKAEYMVLPRLSAVAEINWTPLANQSWQSFSARLPNLFARFDAMDVNAARSVYAITAVAKTIGSGEDAQYQVSLLTDTKQVDIRYTTDGSQPNHRSALYTGPFTIDGNTLVRARSQDKHTGDFYLESRLSTLKHKAVGAEVSLSGSTDTEWNTNPAQTLVDGITRADQIFQLDDWATFTGDTIEITLALANEQTISLIEIGFQPGKHRQMYPPSGLEIFSSSDGKQWQSLGKADPQDLNKALTRVSHQFPTTSTRHIRIVAENKTQVVSTETGKPKSVTLYFDEIIVK